MRKNIYQGYEVQKHRVIMTGRMVFQVSSACLMLQLLFFMGDHKDRQHTLFLALNHGREDADSVPGVALEMACDTPGAPSVSPGGKTAHTIINSCGSKLVLNLGDPDAARFFSELASEEEYCRRSNMDIDKFDQAQTDAGSHRD